MRSVWSLACEQGPVMRWEDEGMVLSSRRWGESSLVVQILTREHGRHAGLVRGGGAARHMHIYAPGNRVSACWSGRLSEHLGHFSCELVDARAARVLERPLRLVAMSSVCALAEWFLAEREPAPGVHATSEAMLDRLAGAEEWRTAYVLWELSLLRDTGAGLDLSQCAVTGATADLAYVSPKSGCAVSRIGAGSWAPRLLPLPEFMFTGGAAGRDDILAGLSLTGFFMSRNARAHGRRSLPAARIRLEDSLVAEAPARASAGGVSS